MFRVTDTNLNASKSGGMDATNAALNWCPSAERNRSHDIIAWATTI